MNILLADDDRSGRDLMREIVTFYPAHILTEVDDGEQAWALLQDPENHFDLVIMDLSTPPLDGLGLTAQMRNVPALKRMPVILCTAVTSRETVERAGQLYIRHFVVKPYRRELLHAKLQAVATETAARMAANQSDADRLGISMGTVSRLSKDLMDQVRDWLATAREAQTPHEFAKLTIKANELRRQADRMGLSALSRKLSDVETKFTTDFSTQYGEMLPPSRLEIASELVGLQAELDRLSTRLGLRD